MIRFYNENWYYLYLEDGNGGIVSVPPESEIYLPEYFLKYQDNFIKEPLPVDVYTPYPVGSNVVVRSSIQEIDGQEGVIVGKDEISYFIDFGTDFGEIKFPWSVVELLDNPTEEYSYPEPYQIILYI